MNSLFKIFFSALLFTFATSNIKAGEDYNLIKNHNFLYLIDYETGEVLLEKNANTRLAPSSMTKIMTAYIAFDQIKQGNISLDNQCIIGKDAWRKRGSTMFLNYGDIVSIDKLLKGLLVASGNDAAIALAQATGKNYDDFISLMNLKAKEIGLKNSQFRNPHGLSENGHYMSVKDLAILLSRFYKDFPEYKKYLSIKKVTYSNITQRNRNPLIKHHYEGIVAGKTGHTNDGGYGITASVRRNNRTLIGVVNKAKWPSLRTKIIEELFDYGFQEFKKIEIFKKNEIITNLKTWNGTQEKVKVATNQDIIVTIPQKTDIKKDILVTVNYQSPIFAPIIKDTKVATLIIKIKNYKTLKFPLFSQETIKKARFFDSISKKLDFIFKRIYQKARYKIKSIIEIN